MDEKQQSVSPADNNISKDMTKKDRFKRVAQRRTRRVLDSLQRLTRCANPNVYEYTPEEAEKILNVVRAEVQRLELAFKKEEPGKFTL